MDTKIYVQSVQVLYQRQVEKCNIANSLVFKNREKENNKAINKKLYEENILNLIKNELVYATNLLREHPEGIVLASAFIIKHNKCANLFMDGYNSEYKNFNAKHLLIWKLIEKYSLEKFRKSITEPYINRSKKLPKIPPISIPYEKCSKLLKYTFFKYR